MADNRVQIIIDALNLAQDDLTRLQKDLKGVGPAAKEGSKGLDLLKKVAATVGLAKLGQEALQFTKESIMLSARVETLGIVTETLGKNAGYTADEIHKLEQSVADQGITMQKSRESLALMMQSQIDLAYATDLARMAQDTAVISNKNSSDAFRDLVHIVQTGSVLMARNAGIAVSFTDAYDEWAAANGRTTESLTEQERVMIRLNTVLAAGVTVQGTYDAAMETAGKKISSYPRHLEALQVAFGDLFQGVLAPGVDILTATTDELTGLLVKLQEYDTVASELETSLRKGSISIEDYAARIRKAKDEHEKLVSVLLSLWTPLGLVKGGFESVQKSLSPVVGLVMKLAKLKPSQLGIIGKILGIDDLEGSALTILENEQALQRLDTSLIRAGQAAERYAVETNDADDAMLSYAEHVWDAAEAQRNLTPEVEDADKVLGQYAGNIMKAGWETYDLAEATDELKMSMDDLQLSMSTDFTADFTDTKEEYDELIQKAENLRNEIYNFEHAQGSASEEGQKKLGELREELSETEDAIGDLQKAWDKQTDQMLFDLAKQQLAVDGLTLTEIEALAALAGPDGLGMVDQAWVDLMETVGEWGAQLSTGEITIDEYREKIRNLDGTLDGLDQTADQAAEKISNISNQMSLLPSSKTISIRLDQIDSIGLPSLPGPSLTPWPGTGHATGIDMIIPPGYNDNYPLGFGKSGERFTVQTPAQQRSSAAIETPEQTTAGSQGRGVYIDTVMINNGMDLQDFQAMLRSALQ